MMIIKSIALFVCCRVPFFHFIHITWDVFLWVHSFLFFFNGIVLSCFWYVFRYTFLLWFHIIEFSTMFGRLTLGQVVDVLSLNHQHHMKIGALEHRLEFVSHPGQCAWKNYSSHVHRGNYTMRYELLGPKPTTQECFD